MANGDDDDLDGGDISSGFGVPKKGGPVSDERAEQMLHGRAAQVPPDGEFAVDPAGTVTRSDESGDDEDPAGERRPDAGGGGGGGGW